MTGNTNTLHRIARIMALDVSFRWFCRFGAPLAVQACFGGLAVFQRHALTTIGGTKVAHCHFEPSADSWHDAHFGFHACIREAAAIHAAVHGGEPPGTWINPSMMVHYDTESAREFCSLTACEPPDTSVGGGSSSSSSGAGGDAGSLQECAFAVWSHSNQIGRTISRSVALRSGWTHAHSQRGAVKPKQLVSAVEEDCNEHLKEAAFVRGTTSNRSVCCALRVKHALCVRVLFVWLTYLLLAALSSPI